MHHGRPLCPGPHAQDHFPDGIVNAGEWNAQSLTLQDFSYKQAGIIELSIFTGCCKFPDEKSLQLQWKDHKNALIKLMSQVSSCFLCKFLSRYLFLASS